MELRINTQGFETAMRQLEPQRAYEIVMRWYATATVYVKNEMRARAPASLRGKVGIKMDGMRPPRWAVIRPKSRLTPLIEGGTGSQGAAGFTHGARHWPSTPGIMRATGLPQPEAFLVARSIGLRGGNPARPFIKPTYEAIRGEVVRMMDSAIQDVLK